MRRHMPNARCWSRTAAPPPSSSPWRRNHRGSTPARACSQRCYRQQRRIHPGSVSVHLGRRRPHPPRHGPTAPALPAQPSATAVSLAAADRFSPASEAEPAMSPTTATPPTASLSTRRSQHPNRAATTRLAGRWCPRSTPELSSPQPTTPTARPAPRRSPQARHPARPAPPAPPRCGHGRGHTRQDRDDPVTRSAVSMRPPLFVTLAALRTPAFRDRYPRCRHAAEQNTARPRPANPFPQATHVLSAVAIDRS